MPKLKHADCPDDCCGAQTCGDFCPDGAPEQYQITVTEATYTASAIPESACEETRCDERSGVRLVNLVAPADIQSKGIPQNSVPEDLCVWVSEDFESCYQTITPDVGFPFEDVRTFRYVLQMGIGGGVLQVDLYLVQVSGLGGYSPDYDRWQLIADADDYECGDLLTLAWYDDALSLGGGCVLDTTETISVELPP